MLVAVIGLSILSIFLLVLLYKLDKKMTHLSSSFMSAQQELNKVKQTNFNAELEYVREKSKLERRLAEEKEMMHLEIDKLRKQKLAMFDEELELRKTQLENMLALEVLQQREAQEAEIEKIRKETEAITTSIAAEVEGWRAKHNSAIETFKQLEKLQQKENFHKITLSDEESFELEELNQAVKKLKNPMPFRKAIYDIYYKNKMNDLTLRIVGATRVSGIYKITHISSGKVYIGQSVDISDRWKQHAKRGCGADIITNNKLYPAIMEFGLENFSFEIVETTTDTSRLSAMEKYWQDFFQAKEFGYSIK